MNADLILNQIEEIRKRNNRNWMDLARLAFRVAPEEAKQIMKWITSNDKEINALTEQLGEGEVR